VKSTGARPVVGAVVGCGAGSSWASSSVPPSSVAYAVAVQGSPAAPVTSSSSAGTGPAGAITARVCVPAVATAFPANCRLAPGSLRRKVPATAGTSGKPLGSRRSSPAGKPSASTLPAGSGGSSSISYDQTCWAAPAIAAVPVNRTTVVMRFPQPIDPTHPGPDPSDQPGRPGARSGSLSGPYWASGG